MSSEDQEAQEDELLALASIFPKDEFRRAETSNGGKIQVCLELPSNFEISIKSNAAENIFIEDFKDTLSYLPPIVLSFEFPSDYPSTSPPNFTLSCKWLTPKQLVRLCQHLDELWKENAGCVVLFAWTQFLKEETLEYLSIQSPYEIEVCPNVSQNGLPPGETDRCSNAESQEDGVCDKRAIQDAESVSALMKYILEFNESQQKKCFDGKLYMCNICFSEKLGSECTNFKLCNHVYCNICLKDYFEIQIKDGQVHSLNCPEPECSSTATPAQVKELVEEELFSRYDRLLLQSSLDLMPDVVYCPRPSCRAPVMQEPESTMGICPCCHYAFCTLCKMTYHGISPCKVTAAKLLELCLEYQEADEATKKFLELQYGKKVLHNALAEMESKDWLDKNSKVGFLQWLVEKMYGCNKMVCTGCKQYFCWLCMTILTKDKPYTHFNDSTSGCFSRLFEGVEGEENEEEAN
ncbi:E3 ubiquitin- ligase RNF14 isoform X1 [Pelobates cultripes]|uniref:E3 ubiquitin-protein ligase RNF14 n=1 Tax=Pelobates cultripes TaxID=61616 RepID=A0AAD1RS27_PELCU|nr:E3 ubiquitin- ligase RNF14 isoform X1 [Pelobates cultripes]